MEKNSKFGKTRKKGSAHLLAIHLYQLKVCSYASLSVLVKIQYRTENAFFEIPIHSQIDQRSEWLADEQNPFFLSYQNLNFFNEIYLQTGQNFQQHKLQMLASLWTDLLEEIQISVREEKRVPFNWQPFINLIFYCKTHKERMEI